MAESRILSEQEWADFIKAYPDHSHYVTMATRPGVLMLASTVEHYLFDPMSALNGLYQCNAIEWQDMLWSIFSVPQDYHPTIQMVAASLSMKVTRFPPAILHLGKNMMVVSGDPAMSLEMIKAHLARKMGTAEIASMVTSLSRFPCSSSRIFAIENDEENAEVKFAHLGFAAVFEREKYLPALYTTGARPNPNLIVRYVAGLAQAEELG